MLRVTLNKQLRDRLGKYNTQASARKKVKIIGDHNAIEAVLD